MTIVFVHGIPETSEIWTPLLKILDREAVAVELPGFGTPRPEGFTGTKDAYAEWLGMILKQIDPPIDIVGHDLGALLTMRVASGFDILLRSWVVDVADIFHPHFVWPERVRSLQIPGVGEEMLRTTREAPADDPQSTVSRLIGAGVPPNLASVIGKAHDEVMSQSILDFYRSAVHNVATDWWENAKNHPHSRGLVLLLPDPPEIEQMSLEVAERLGADTVRLNDLNHCWMAEAPELVASILEPFWSSLK
jgi:pimeloyl-ACP methyl ester carboxylesterase